MSKETHSFSVDVACRIGVNAAIIIQHLAHLHKVCLGNGENWKAGRYWINKTIRAMSIVYPYLTIKEIRGCIDKMEQEGYIVSAKISENPFDRTKWYSFEDGGFDLLGVPSDLRHVAPDAFAKKANGMSQNGNSDFTQRANENVTKGQMNNKVYYNSYNNYTLSDSQAKSDRKRKTKVDTRACQSVDQSDDAYTFAEFWNDYGHKVGSKTKTETAFGKLSHQDKMSIRSTLPIYLRSTVTKDTARAGGTFRPLRQHPLTYINGRMWKTYEDQVAEQNEQATPYDDNYRAYLDWVQQNFPALLQQTAQLSKPQFVTYKSTSYVRGVREIGSQAELNTLRRAHEEFTTNIALADKYPDVFTYHCSLIEKRVKARQV